MFRCVGSDVNRGRSVGTFVKEGGIDLSGAIAEKDVRKPLMCLLAGVILSIPAIASAVSGASEMDLTTAWHIQGGTPSLAATHAAIRMDSGQVVIRLSPRGYTVDAVFRLFNTGERTTEWVGFPKTQGRGSSVRNDHPWFHAWVDGIKTIFLDERDLEADAAKTAANKFRTPCPCGYWETRWMLKQVTFPGHTTTTIRFKYYAFYGRLHTVFYKIGSARTWKGSIGKASFIIDASRIGGIRHITTRFPTSLGPSPTPRLMSDYVVRYEISQFEPDPQMQLGIECKGLGAPNWADKQTKSGLR